MNGKRRDLGLRTMAVVSTAFGMLLMFASSGMGVSPAGYFAYSATIGPISIPAGTSVADVASVSTITPADGYPTSMANYRAVVFATAGATATTLIVLFPGPGENSPAITVPANRTVPLLFETLVPVNYPGTPISVSLTVIAGAGGGLTIQPGTSLTVEGMPMYPSEREVTTKSRW